MKTNRNTALLGPKKGRERERHTHTHTFLTCFHKGSHARAINSWPKAARGLAGPHQRAGNKGREVKPCGWTILCTSTPRETGSCRYSQGNHQKLGVLRWCRISCIHSITSIRRTHSCRWTPHLLFAGGALSVCLHLAYRTMMVQALDFPNNGNRVGVLLPTPSSLSLQLNQLLFSQVQAETNTETAAAFCVCYPSPGICVLVSCFWGFTCKPLRHCGYRPDP